MTPSRRTSTPELASPATTAASRKSPDARESRPITATGRPGRSGPSGRCADSGASTGTAATARSRASRAVRSRPATPRTPSVPKIRPISGLSGTSGRLALGVLRCLAGLLKAVLLPLLDPRVSGEEARLLQRRAILRVHEDQRAGHAQPQRAGLPGHAAAGDPRDHVETALGAERHEGLIDELLVHLVREVGVERPAVDGPLSGARHDPHPGNGLLAAAGARRVAGDHRPARGPGRGGVLRGLGGVFRRSVLSVETVVGGVLLFDVRRLVWGRLYASGLGHVAIPHASLRHYWEICRISYGCGFCAWCGWSGPA